MFNANRCVWGVVGLLLSVWFTTARADVTWLGHFNNGLDADYSWSETTATVTPVQPSPPNTGPAITTGNTGHVFTGETTSEAIDLGYDNTLLGGRVSYAAPASDLRYGTILCWFKTDFAWNELDPNAPDEWDDCNFVLLPLEGYIANRIQFFWTNRYGGHIMFHICGGGEVNISLSSWTAPSLGIDISAGVWHYAACTWTPTQVRMFVDGKLVDEASTTLNIPVSTGTIFFGAADPLWPGDDCPGHALIDEVRISNRALFAGMTEIPVPTVPLDTVDESPIVVGAAGGGAIQYANPRKIFKAAPFASPPTIDGHLTDAVWQTAPKCTGFTKPSLDFPYATNQTDIRVGWTETTLYVGVASHEANVESLVANASGEDANGIWNDDGVELFLSEGPDVPATFYKFCLNTLTAYLDAQGSNTNWDGTWQHAVYRDTANHKWTVEYAIPFSAIGAQVPVEGTMWRWEVGRNRRAGGIVDSVTSLAEIVSEYNEPAAFDKLVFSTDTLNVQLEEETANETYYTVTHAAITSRRNDGQQELDDGAVIVARAVASGKTDNTQTQRAALQAWVDQYTVVLGYNPITCDDYNLTRLTFPQFDQAVLDYVTAVNALGFGSASLPPDLPNGISQSGSNWYLKSSNMAVSVDSVTGLVNGVWDSTGQQIVACSYDKYYIETTTATQHSDERVDTAGNITSNGTTLTVTCTNPRVTSAAAGTQIVKKYAFATVGGQQRIVAKEVSVSSTTAPAVNTLLSLVSQTFFNSAFKEQAYYHRVRPTGTSGDVRSVFPATGIPEPIKLFYLFTYGSMANLCAVNTQRNNGLGEYFYKANGNWVMPSGYESNPTLLTNTGWNMSWFVTFIGTTPQSGEKRYHFFSGDRIAFHEEYRDLPERQAVVDAVAVSGQAKNCHYWLGLSPLYGGTNFHDVTNPVMEWGGKTLLEYPRLRSNECSSGGLGFLWYDVFWGDYPAGDGSVIHWDTTHPEYTYPCLNMKNDLAGLYPLYPKLMSFYYHLPQFIDERSQLYKDHLGWVRKGKDGKPVYSGWSGRLGNFSPEWLDYLLTKLTQEMDYYGMKFIYIDYSAGIHGPVVDWQNGVVRQTDVELDFLRDLYEAVQQRGGILEANSTTFDGLYDRGCYESFVHWDTGGCAWRDLAEDFMMRNLYQRPDSRTVPLHWMGGENWGATRNYKDYTNAALSHLFYPKYSYEDPFEVFMDPNNGNAIDWVSDFGYGVAYDDTLYEAQGALWKDVNILPCWWRDDNTEIEAYGFAKGNAYIFTALRHSGDTADQVVSAEMAKMGFDVNKPTFVWQYYTRDCDEIDRHYGVIPDNWTGPTAEWDQLFTGTTCTIVQAGGADPRLSMTLPGLEANLTRLLSVTQVPAAFISLEEKGVNLRLSSVIGSSIDGTLTDTGVSYQLTVNAAYPSEIIVYLPEGADSITVNSAPQTIVPVAYGDVDFALVSVPQGASTVVVSQPNTPPTVNLTAPADNSVYLAPSSVTLTATASDSDGTSSRVEFYEGVNHETYLGQDTTPPSPFTFSWSNPAAGKHTLWAKAYDNDGASTWSDPVVIWIWATMNINASGGSASYNSGTGAFTVGGRGSGIRHNYTTDSFRFVYLPVSGDCTIIAKVTAFSSTNTNARAGVMVRETTASNAKHVSSLLAPSYSPDREYQHRRTTTGGYTTATSYLTQNVPCWVKVVRSGTTFNVWRAPDSGGSPGTWGKIGSDVTGLSMSDPLVGLAVTSGNTGSTSTATINNVSITQP